MKGQLTGAFINEADYKTASGMLELFYGDQPVNFAILAAQEQTRRQQQLQRQRIALTAEFIVDYDAEAEH
jgi:hypothetical protein